MPYIILRKFGTTRARVSASDMVRIGEMKSTLEMVKIRRGLVHCPICTHTVSADIDMVRKRPLVVAGQKCPRCSCTLDAAYVLEVPEAA